MAKHVTIEVIKGVDGNCLSINDERVSGPKPWGGGKVTNTFKVYVKDIRRLIK